jgi:hypothetical protein
MTVAALAENEELLDLAVGELLEDGGDEFLDAGEFDTPGMYAFETGVLNRKIEELQTKLLNRERETERLVKQAREQGKKESKAEIEKRDAEYRALNLRFTGAVNALEIAESKYEVLLGSLSDRLVPNIERLEARIKDEERKWVWYLECLKFFLDLVDNRNVKGLTLLQSNIVRCIRDWIKAPPKPIYRPTPEGTPLQFLTKLFEVSAVMGAGHPPKPDVDIQEIDRSKFISTALKGPIDDKDYRTMPHETMVAMAQSGLLTYSQAAAAFLAEEEVEKLYKDAFIESDHPTASSRNSY